MFRDTYKAANCDINPDSKFLSQMLSRVEQAEKKPAIIPIRTIGACAAALAVMIGSVYGYIHYTDIMTLDVAPNVIMADTAPEPGYSSVQPKASTTAESADISADNNHNQPATVAENDSAPVSNTASEPAEKNSGKSVASKSEKTVVKEKTAQQESPAPTQKKAGKPDKADSVPDTAQSIAPDTDRNTTPDTVQTITRETDTPAETTVSDAAAPSAAENAEITVESDSKESTSVSTDVSPVENRPSSGGGGSASDTRKNEASAFDESEMHFTERPIIAYNEIEQENMSDSSAYMEESPSYTDYPSEITYGEYCEYIGHDLYEELVMPEDILAERWTTTEFDPENDEVVLIYKGSDGRYAEVIPTKNTQKTYDSINACDTEEKTSDSAISYNGDNTTAYIVNGDVGYTVNCTGFDKKEFTALTESIPH